MTIRRAELLCDVWREVSRHLDIEEFVRGLYPRLAATLPLSYLLVRRWDAPRSRLDTIAAYGPGVPELAPHRTVAPTPRREDLVRWAAEGDARQWLSRVETSLSRFVLPDGFGGPAVAGPLRQDGQLAGVVVFGGDLREDLPLVAELVEPFEVALANDHRLHELAQLREAADADRRALLTRLGREDVSDAIVGSESGLREVMERVDQVAPTDAPVLILGETGSGKEVVGRAIHRRSRRARGPFLRVNCGAIPPELVDSELFGHERGSFTGAVAQRKGWFERADGGTLFLDEVGELPAAAQVRLLRVLQDGTFSRVGGQETHSVDVRIVAATHRDVSAMVRDGRFRLDLWYRISVFPIRLPALRERKEDIALLARHFAERAGTRLFGRPLRPTDDDIATLFEYDWPGNVRELASVIERAAILGSGTDLNVAVALGSAASRGDGAEAGEREQIVAAVRKARGRIEGPFGAAAALGVNPHTLRSRMRRLGIDWSQFRG